MTIIITYVVLDINSLMSVVYEWDGIYEYVIVLMFDPLCSDFDPLFRMFRSWIKTCEGTGYGKQWYTVK